MFETRTKGESKNTSSESEYSKKSESKYPRQVNTATYGEILVYPQKDINKNQYNKDVNQDIENLTLTYNFDLKQKEEIKKFLRENQEIIEVLQAAKDEIKSRFQNETLYLEYEDGEECEVGGELFLNIQTKKDVDEARKLISEFEDRWLADKWVKTNNKLSIDVRFIK
jgi:hypothetical protein